MRELPARR